MSLSFSEETRVPQRGEGLQSDPVPIFGQVAQRPWNRAPAAQLNRSKVEREFPPLTEE
jgi:hypothetical protein